MRSMLLISSLCFFCAACGGGSDPLPNANMSFADSDVLLLAKPSSAYASVLVDCLSPDDGSSSCQLSRLPIIAQKGPVTADAILDQTLVSHDWMATRFEALLPLLPDDLIELMGATTGVVIAGDIRPSFYTTQTGAINLDAANFWLTNEEKADIETEEDFRSSFGDGLQFVTLGRYLSGNDYAWTYYSLDGTEERQLEDLVEPLSALLFHELAHANDFFPRAEISSLTTDNRVLDEANRLSSQRISEALIDFSPLQSDLLAEIAGVLFFGDTASDELLLLGAEQVGLEFAADLANDDYAYSNQYEDLAMLFEEIMMKHHFDIDRDIAYTDRPSEDSNLCVDYPVRWGQRGRIGDPSVKARASYMLQRLLNQNDVSAYMDDLAAPIAMINGNDWCENLLLTASATKSTAEKTEAIRSFPDIDKQRTRH